MYLGLECFRIMSDTILGILENAHGKIGVCLVADSVLETPLKALTLREAEGGV